MPARSSNVIPSARRRRRSEMRMPHCVCRPKMRPLALVRSRTRCMRRRSRSRSSRSSSEGSQSAGTSWRRESSASRRASTLSVFAASGATVFTLRASATSTCQPQATSSSRTQSAPLIISTQAFTSSPSSKTSRASPSRSAATRPSLAISPPGASAHHCACRYAQSSPTYFISGLLPDGIRHRRVSPARRPFFMTFHKCSIRSPGSPMAKGIRASRHVRVAC